MASKGGRRRSRKVDELVATSVPEMQEVWEGGWMSSIVVDKGVGKGCRALANSKVHAWTGNETKSLMTNLLQRHEAHTMFGYKDRWWGRNRSKLDPWNGLFMVYPVSVLNRLLFLHAMLRFRLNLTACTVAIS